MTEELLVPDETTEGALEWSQSVLWAVKNMGNKKMSRRKAGSQLNYAMWQASQDYGKELITQLTPKALAILEKNRKPEVDQAQEDEEDADLKEWEALLEAAVKESQE